MAQRDGVFKRCGCRDSVTGKSLGARCDRLAEHRHGSWFYTVELPRGPRGHRRRWRRGGFATAELAAAERDRLSASPDRERFGELLTVEQWLDIWLESRVVLRTSTKDGYATHVRLYLKPHLGHVLLADLDRRLLNKAFAAIVKAGSPLGSTLTDASLRRIWTTLRTALNAARREGLITQSAVRTVMSGSSLLVRVV
jgi:hypothetical protein